MFENLDVVGLAVWLVVFLFSTTCHEAAHALVARLGGDETAYRAGQVTLNPVPHVAREPFGMVIVPLFSYVLAGWMIGWASAPYDPRWAERHPKRAAAMAAAGPAANFALAIIAIGALRVLLATGAAEAVPFAAAGFDALAEPAGASAALAAGVRFLSVMATLNVLLGIFNLVPVPPLDGSAVVEGLGGALAEKAMNAFRTLPMASIIGLVAAWRLFSWIAWPAFRALHAVVSGGA